jgi:transcriptional regulator with XRE-family HTH domain
MENVGTAIRQMRQRQGWTLKKLSSLTGLSVSFLSQAERGQSSLSIVSLTNICRALGVDPSQLLSAPKDDRAPDESSFPVIAEENQLCIRIASFPVSYRYLSGGFPGRVIEVLINEFPAAYHHPLAAHPGEEFGYVLEGDLTLRIGEESYPLSPGDSYHFVASRTHGYETSRKGGARVLMATTQKFLEWHTGARPAKGLA